MHSKNLRRFLVATLAISLGACGGGSGAKVSTPPPPASSPTAPGNLGANATSATQVNLTWTAATETGGTISQYLIERCTGTGCTDFSQIATATSTSYSDSTLSPSTTYTYRVRAKDSAGVTGAFSNSAAATTSAQAGSVPTAPGSLAASAGSSTQINLTWTAATETGGTISQYLIERCAGTGCAAFAQVGTATGTSYSDSALSSSSTYSYRVRAKDSAGVTGAYSNTASATTAAAPPPPPSAGTDVVTYKNNVARTGLNATETVLTTTNVNSTQFGKLHFLATDGKVDAQPLYLSGLTVQGARHNVVFVASENDSVYAFDADSGATLWKVSLLGSGETAAGPSGCDQISPTIGITSTPVIDRGAGTHGAIYVVAASSGSGSVSHQRLHALDVTTGTELFGGPRDITANYAVPGGGTLSFDPGKYAERAALLRVGGAIYTAWTSHCDQPVYTGWVISYDQATLAQRGVLNVAAHGTGSGYSTAGPAIWMSGGGPAADASGNVYLLTGNGAFETTLNSGGFPSGGDYGNSFVKITASSGALAVSDYFSPHNTVSLSQADTDLGSGGIMLLPDLTDSGATVRHLAVGAGKDGNIYVVDRDAMGKFNSSANSIWQQLSGAVPGGVYATPAWFNNTLYYGPVSGSILAFPVSNARLATSSSSRTSHSFTYPGSAPAISANGTSNGILWAHENSTPAVLHAYDAGNLGRELYNSGQNAARDALGPGNKFITPTIADGKVFVGTQTGVAVFGLL